MALSLQKNYLVGVDIGGTKIRTILLKDKEILENLKVEIGSRITKGELIEKIKESIEMVVDDIDRKKINGIGIGAPGPLDLKKGKLLFSPNMLDIKDVPLAKIIQRKLKIRTVMDNDANCAALAESILGAGEGLDNLVFLNLGTGVGGGIVMGGKLYHGVNSSAGEIGHMIIEKDGYPCSCGNKGCLEAYVSAKGVKRRIRGLVGREIEPFELTKLARKGNRRAVEVYKNVGEYLGIGLANIVNILNPDIIIVGGGITGAGKFLLEPAKKIMKKNITSPLARNTKVVISKLGENAGAIGAALLLESKN